MFAGEVAELAEVDVFGDRDVSDRSVFLDDDADAAGKRIDHGGGLPFFAVVLHVSTGGFVDSRHDGRHRGFARAVLSNEAANFAGIDGDIDVIECDGRSKLLHNVRSFEYWFFHIVPHDDILAKLFSSLIALSLPFCFIFLS